MPQGGGMAASSRNSRAMAYYATRQVLDDLEQIRLTLQEASEVMADFQDVREFENMVRIAETKLSRLVELTLDTA